MSAERKRLRHASHPSHPSHEEEEEEQEDHTTADVSQLRHARSCVAKVLEVMEAMSWDLGERKIEQTYKMDTYNPYKRTLALKRAVAEMSLAAKLFPEAQRHDVEHEIVVIRHDLYLLLEEQQVGMTELDGVAHQLESCMDAFGTVWQSLLDDEYSAQAVEERVLEPVYK